MALPLLLEFLVVLLKLVYFIVEWFVLLLVPRQHRSKDVTGQTVLITGAGSGLGKLMALKFAKLGCPVVLWDINESANEGTAKEVREFGVAAHAYQCDLSSSEDASRVAEKVKKEVGDIDILVNNAGMVSGKQLLEGPDVLIKKTFAVNTVAHFWTIRAFLPAMLAKDRGHIVTIASGAGLFGANGMIDYCSSKFGAIGMHESLTLELEKQGKAGVKATVVCPFLVGTGMFDGAKTRFPMLIPILEPDYVVDETMNAILTNENMIILPRILYVFYFLKSFMPMKAQLLLAKFFGTCEIMDNFRGRGPVKED